MIIVFYCHYNYVDMSWCEPLKVPDFLNVIRSSDIPELFNKYTPIKLSGEKLASYNEWSEHSKLTGLEIEVK